MLCAINARFEYNHQTTSVHFYSFTFFRFSSLQMQSGNRSHRFIQMLIVNMFPFLHLFPYVLGLHFGSFMISLAMKWTRRESIRRKKIQTILDSYQFLSFHVAFNFGSWNRCQTRNTERQSQWLKVGRSARGSLDLVVKSLFCDFGKKKKRRVLLPNRYRHSYDALNRCHFCIFV